MDNKNKKETKKMSIEEEYIKHQQDALFREVEEQVHIENMRKFWKKYGNTIIGIALLVLLGVAGFEAFKQYKKNVSYAVTNEYLKAAALVSADKKDEASEVLNRIAAENKNGLGDFAALYATVLKSDNAKEILSLTEKKNIFPPLKEYLLISYAYGNIDTKSETEINEIVNSITDTLTWKGAISEIKALAALKAGKKDDALTILNAITEDPEVTASFKSRAKKLLQTIKK